MIGLMELTDRVLAQEPIICAGMVVEPWDATGENAQPCTDTATVVCENCGPMCSRHAEENCKCSSKAAKVFKSSPDMARILLNRALAHVQTYAEDFKSAKKLAEDIIKYLEG